MFDMNRFVESLAEVEKTPKSDYGRGVLLVLDYVFLHCETAEVDFDAFTVKDVEKALQEAYNVPLDDERIGVKNALFDFDRHYKVISALHGMKREYYHDDDFI